MKWDMSRVCTITHMTTTFCFQGKCLCWICHWRSLTANIIIPPSTPPSTQQPAARQSPTQAECRWNINSARAQWKKHMWSLESFRKFYCRNTCVRVADGSNYGRKSLPCAENQIPIEWDQANDFPWGQVKLDHSEFWRSASLALGCDRHCWKLIKTWYYLCLIFHWKGMRPQTHSSKINVLFLSFLLETSPHTSIL